MNKKIFLTFKKSIISMIPIILLVILLSVFMNISFSYILKFLISSIMIIFGVTFYLTGFDMSYPKIANRICNGLIKRKNIFYILGMCFFMGTIISLVAKELLEASGNNVSLLLLISFSIGFFFLLSIYRILTKTNFKVYLIISYIIVFLLMIKSNMIFIPFALDRAALGTGAVSAPFLLTIGMAFSRKNQGHRKNHTSFGILGLSAVGPIIVFLILGIFTNINITTRSLRLRESLIFIILSIIPIIILYLFFLKFNIKKYKKEIKNVLKGFFFVLLGISLYYTGAKFGYLEIAGIIGEKLVNTNIIINLIIAGILGFLILKIEPSFVFLMNYVNDVTSGGIKEKFLEWFLSLGVAFSFALSIMIVIYKINILVVLIPSFFLAILLAFFTPNTFLSIAFDSLGAVIGTISSSFFLPILIAISHDNLVTYGFLAFIGIIPVIFLELAGFIYEKELIMHDYNNFDDRIVGYD